MKLIKVQAKKTYVGKDGKEHHYYNYFVEMANGKRIQIKCAYAEDYAKLDLVAEYVR